MVLSIQLESDSHYRSIWMPVLKPQFMNLMVSRDTEPRARAKLCAFLAQHKEFFRNQFTILGEGYWKSMQFRRDPCLAEYMMGWLIAEKLINQHDISHIVREGLAYIADSNPFREKNAAIFERLLRKYDGSITKNDYFSVAYNAQKEAGIAEIRCLKRYLHTMSFLPEEDFRQEPREIPACLLNR